ncbi:Six-hairpin glycosidase [Aspergillus novofumigatus IBT 16806]|uniref:Six-hairpin glycosidase n=1 Tax=Aspergillus novofumigatus (strain IBT 16806) TaxID=1392255 RepID=A0A2I1CAL2_ASPN1|nr:Six-hairpin glycosidase [Aspergillus novofumigatus IBT 16806]PKX94663.1 Six-hairpin glycosidase [Aspergillus novofumigatus IBT 16806]
MTRIHFLNVVLSLLTLLPVVLAQTCWRNTTCSGPEGSAFEGPWEQGIYAPSSRTVRPKKILSITNLSLNSAYAQAMPATLHGNGSLVIFDFGIEVGGIVTLNYTSSGSGALGIAFTEAKNWIGEWSDSSNGAFKGPDGALYTRFTKAGKGSYTMPDEALLFVVTNDSTKVQIEDVSLELGFQPTWSNLRAYQGYFHSNDELLNRVWYSGAYTLQTNSVPVDTGRQVPMLHNGWANNATLGPGDTIIVDGAKRDRAVWPGDMGIAVPSAFVSTGDLESVKNALQVMYNTQNTTTGAFDESGPPLSQKNSDTYHMWTMIGTYNYVLFSNDTDFLSANWQKYQAAMDFIYGKTGAQLAAWADSTSSLVDTWNTRADNLKKAINQYCWDDAYGAFKDNATATTLHPQDANSMAVLFGIVNQTRAASISERLTDNWTPIGAVAPELPENISPFISSFEIQCHFAAGQPTRALELIRRSWGWYLNNPNGTESTVIEGYLANGTFGYRSSRGYSYDASYVSHAHGWSAGPTSALTNYVVGLSITSPGGMTWKIAPQFGDLKSAEAGFTTLLGKYKASWKRYSKGYMLQFSVPQGTMGTLTLPFVRSPKKPSIKIDGHDIKRGLAYENETATVTQGAISRSFPWRTCGQCLRRQYLQSNHLRSAGRFFSTVSPLRTAAKNPLRSSGNARTREAEIAQYRRSMTLSAAGIAACAVAMYGVIKMDLFGLSQLEETKPANNDRNSDANNGALKLDGPDGFPSSPSVIRIQGQDGVEQVATGTSTVPHFPSTIRLPRSLDDPSLKSGEDLPAGPGVEEDEYQLLGLGIRTVSFLQIQVYVVGLYVAKEDISELQQRLVRTAVNPPGRDSVIRDTPGATSATSLVSTERQGLKELLLDPEMGEAAWAQILKQDGLRTAFRIVPTRNTDFLHLRDGWVRANAKAKEGAAGAPSEFEDESFGAAMNEFKSLFGGGQRKNVPKGQTLLLVRNARGELNALFHPDPAKPMRFLGRVADERISRLVWLNYLAGKTVSSEGARQSVVDGVMGIVERPVGTVVLKVV